jgi:DNA-binding transcriptional regulator GbsR (MarR family)
MQEIIRELATEFDLKGKHLLILDALYLEDLSAQQISKKTGIPMGRIYNFLNDLLSYGLVEKTSKKPALYSMKNPSEKITNFLKFKFDKLVEKENKIFDLIEKKQKIESLEVVHSGDEFTFKQIQLLSECNEIRTVVRHGSIPFPIYPSNSEEFQKVRSVIVENRATLAHTTHEMTFLIHKAHKDAYMKGKHFSAIIEKNALDFNLEIIKAKLGNKFLRKMIRDILQKIQKYGIDIYVIQEYVPMQIFITERKVMLSIIHLGITTGVIISSQDVVTLYRDFYDEMIQRSKPITQFIKY